MLGGDQDFYCSLLYLFVCTYVCVCVCMCVLPLSTPSLEAPFNDSPDMTGLWAWPGLSFTWWLHDQSSQIIQYDLQAQPQYSLDLAA